MADPLPKTKTVAVIGAGSSGLASIKQCLEDGLSVQCFEKGTQLGGQWAYSPNATPEVHSSMYDGCILNSCRDTSSFTDFPIDPARYGDYFSHRLQLRYLNEYADYFGLKQHVRLRTSVLQCLPAPEGGWTLKVQEEGKEVEELWFDVVFACTGSNATPTIPEFAGRELFRGEFFHSHFYRTPGRFEGKRVAIIGTGSSGVDIACEIAPHAQVLHHVTRRGVWVLPRFVLGKPLEAWDDRATQVWVPFSVAQYLQTKLFHIVCGQVPKELTPEHKMLEQNPTIRSDYYEKVETGVVTPHKTSVGSFTETGLILSNGETLEVDVVICATGYKVADFPYLPADAVRSRDAPAPHVDLYKNLITPWYDNLYILGQVELFGPLAPAIEAQARLSCAILTGLVPRPSQDAMLKAIKARRAWKAKNMINTDRHILTDHWVHYIDSLLEPLQANPTVARLIFNRNPFRGLKTFKAVYFGMPASAQWRLFGHGKKEALARETVLRVAGGKKEFSKGEKRLLERKQ